MDLPIPSVNTCKQLQTGGGGARQSMIGNKQRGYNRRILSKEYVNEPLGADAFIFTPFTVRKAGYAMASMGGRLFL